LNAVQSKRFLVPANNQLFAILRSITRALESKTVASVLDVRGKKKKKKNGSPRSACGQAFARRSNYKPHLRAGDLRSRREARIIQGTVLFGAWLMRVIHSTAGLKVHPTTDPAAGRNCSRKLFSGAFFFLIKR